MCVGRCSRRSSVHTVVVYREVPSFSFPPLNQPPPSALTEPVNKTCQQPIGGELLQTQIMDQSRVPGSGPKSPPRKVRKRFLSPDLALLCRQPHRGWTHRGCVRGLGR